MWWRIHSQNLDGATGRAAVPACCCKERLDLARRTRRACCTIGSGVSARLRPGAFSFARNASMIAPSRCTTEMFETTATDRQRQDDRAARAAASDGEFANSAFDTGVKAAPKIR
jgi:hypothetical protein